ncbi:hypothetical protein XACM_3156 [Xanthomonas euvesicatoria pv. citrumelo F1]|nr:hypothetical protein XACM_3156 [Xanthomonas euvesicatoria pv. citrumelo F1]
MLFSIRRGVGGIDAFLIIVREEEVACELPRAASAAFLFEAFLTPLRAPLCDPLLFVVHAIPYWLY